MYKLSQLSLEGECTSSSGVSGWHSKTKSGREGIQQESLDGIQGKEEKKYKGKR